MAGLAEPETISQVTPEWTTLGCDLDNGPAPRAAAPSRQARYAAIHRPPVISLSKPPALRGRPAQCVFSPSPGLSLCSSSTALMISFQM